MCALRVQSNKSGKQNQIKELNKQIQKLQSKIDAPFGGLGNIGALHIAVLGVAVVADLTLGMFGLMSVGTLDGIDWVIDLALMLYFILMTLALMFSSSSRLPSMGSMIFYFVGALAFEIIPFTSWLPLWTGLVVKVISALNKAQMMTQVDAIKKQIKELEKEDGGSEQEKRIKLRQRVRNLKQGVGDAREQLANKDDVKEQTRSRLQLADTGQPKGQSKSTAASSERLSTVLAQSSQKQSGSTERPDRSDNMSEQNQKKAA